jgi:glycosyltransferase involved in cell wall biosynthesis
VLFVNTRSYLGADVAVHLMLIKHFDPQEVEAHIVNNRHCVDLDKTLAALKSVPNLQPRLLDLGTEMSRSVPGKVKAGKLLAALNNIGLIPSLLRLSLYVWKNRIDVIHATDRPRDALVSMLLSRMTGRPHVVHLHIKWYPEIGRITSAAVKRCGGAIAISQFVRRSLIEGGVPQERIYTVLNASEPEVFDPARVQGGHLRRALDLSPETPLIGIVARVMFWKGHHDLIEALALVRAELPAVQLAIVGHEDLASQSGVEYSRRLRGRIAELGMEDCVRWVGWREDTPEVMADLDILAVPSWEEPFGLVVTEAMAMERPVVGYASGALPEIITSGMEGLLVPAGDTRALADALITLLKDPARRMQMGRLGRERVLSRLTPQRQAHEMAEVYRRILAGLPDVSPAATSTPH